MPATDGTPLIGCAPATFAGTREFGFFGAFGVPALSVQCT